MGHSRGDQYIMSRGNRIKGITDPVFLRALGDQVQLAAGVVVLPGGDTEGIPQRHYIFKMTAGDP